ncbi:peroxisomal membrane protein 11A isoform X5 [Rhineura floridana]|nr:peroxisomal membrane protein 11A isoform X5 [Rhineura floridana]XP_061451406.1 peroxisomal membrane protein 11A isoform X5 [Rhineura floridana]
MLLSYMLEHKTNQEKVVMKIKHLEASLNSGRKLFRLGNMVHAIVAARQATQLPHLVPRFCLTVSNLSRALYFVCDTVLWVKSVGLLSDIKKKKWGNWATKCYYYSLMINLAEDLYELCWRMEQAARMGKPKEDSSPCGPQFQSLVSLATGGLQPFLLLLCKTLRKHPPLLLDTVKNLCDLSSPLDRLGICKSNPGVIGLCGLISSIVGILTVARPHLRLKH